MESNIDATGDDPEVDMRGHVAFVPAYHGARLNGLEYVYTGLEFRSGAAPATKVRIKCRLLSIGDVVVATIRIGLPDLKQRIGHRHPCSIQHAPFNANTLSLRIDAD